MKNNFKVMMVLFATIVSVFLTLINSSYYTNQFRDKTEMLTYVSLPSEFVDDTSFNNDVKETIVSNNHDAEYIIGDGDSIVRYISGNLETINYYDKLNKVNYITKPMSQLEDKFMGPIGFSNKDNAISVYQQLHDKYGIAQEEFISSTVSATFGGYDIFMVLGAIALLVLVIYVYCVTKSRSTKEIGINLVQGNKKHKTFYNVYKLDIITYILATLIIVSTIIYFGINISISSMMLILVLLWLLIPIICILNFYLTMRYNNINSYLKNKYQPSGLIYFSRLIFFIVIIIISGLISFTPQGVSMYKDLLDKKEYIEQYQDIYILEPKVLGNKGPSQIHDLLEWSDDLFEIYNQVPELFFVTYDDNKELVERGYSDTHVISVTIDPRYVELFNLDLAYSNSEPITYIDDSIYERYTSNSEPQNTITGTLYETNVWEKRVNKDLDSFRINCYDYNDPNSANLKPDVIRILPMNNGDSLEKHSGGIRYKGNDVNAIQNKIDTLSVKYSLDDDKLQLRSMGDIYKQILVTINSMLIFIIIIAIASLLVGIITIWILVDLLVAIKIKEIMVKKLNGFKFFSIYKKDIIIINILTILGSSVVFFIDKNLIFNILLLISLLIIINVVNILIIKKIENKRLLDMLKQE